MFNLVGRLTLKDGASSVLKQVMGGLSATAALAGTTALAFSSLNKAMDYESQMSSIKALTGASSAEMTRMSNLAMEMGASTKYSSLQAAEGIEELLKSGLTPAAVEAGGLEAALNLATAGGLELAEASEIMSTSLNAFKRETLAAEEASNILAGTANASATDVHDLRYALAETSAVAAAVGMSFKDMNTALGILANNGIKGSSAGTGLKTMLGRLQPTTKENIALFKKLGIITKSGTNQFYNAKEQLKDLSEVSDVLKKSLNGMSDMKKSAVLLQMFGEDAQKVATILATDGADGVRKFHMEMSKVTALDVAKQKMDNAKGAMEQLGGAIETIQISAMQPLLPVIKDLSLMFADIATQYGPAITATFEDMGKSIRDFMDPYVNDPKKWEVTGQAEFKFKQAEIMDRQMMKPTPFFDALVGRFDEWYEDSGKQMMKDGAARVAKDFGTFLEENALDIAKAGLTIGARIATSVSQGLRSEMENSALGKAILNANPALNLGDKAGNQIWEWLSPQPKKPDEKAYHGISYVPRDGMTVQMHKGERVLTAKENREYSGGSGGAPVVNISMNGVTIREEADIDRLAYRLAREMHALA
ncbi:MULTISPECIES: phage tail tape measure protein [unclassified Brevibacillus]|uniref:phage tail tape measure protein n=1 Tax=unclassified Brevibacillus TaxID=2684853 RepID=UPI00356649F7